MELKTIHSEPELNSITDIELITISPESVSLNFTPAGCVCISIEGSEDPQLKEDLQQIARGLQAATSSAGIWHVSNTEDNTIFYYWDTELLKIYEFIIEDNTVNSCQINESTIAKAHNYLKSENRRDRIWEDAILSFSQVVDIDYWREFVSLLNPLSDKDNFILSNKPASPHLPCEISFTDFPQSIDIDKIHSKLDSIITDIVEYLTKVPHDNFLISKQLAELSSEQLVNQISLLSNSLLNIFKHRWQEGEYGTRKKYGSIIEPNLNRDILAKLNLILIELNAIKMLLEKKDYYPVQCSNDIFDASMAATPFETERKCEKIILPFLVAYELRYLFYPMPSACINFYFKQKLGAESFYQQFCEKYMLRKNYGFEEAGFHIQKPKKMDDRFLVQCSDTSIHFVYSIMKQRSNKIDVLWESLKADPCEIDSCRNHWLIFLDTLSSYFEIPGVDIIRASEFYQVAPHENRLKIRWDNNPNYLTIIRIPTVIQDDYALMVEDFDVTDSNRDVIINRFPISNNSLEDLIRMTGPYSEIQEAAGLKHCSLSLSKRPKGVDPRAVFGRSRLEVSISNDNISGTKAMNEDGYFQKNQKTRVFFAPGFPIKTPGTMPYHRKYGDYIKLLESNQTDEILKDKRDIYVNPYLESLPKGAKILDVGPGSGKVVAYTKKNFDFTVIAAGVTPLDEENLVLCDEVYYAPEPDNLRLLKDHMSSFDCITDVFAACTYADNPLWALIYNAFLLKKGGHFYSIVSGLPYSNDLSPMGNGEDRARIVAFFKKYLGIDLIIEKTKVVSKVTQGIVEDFVFRFIKEQDFPFENFIANFIAMCEKADIFVGRPHNLIVTGDAFGKFESPLQIKPKTYIRERNQENQYSSFADFKQNSLREKNKDREKEADDKVSRDETITKNY